MKKKDIKWKKRQLFAEPVSFKIRVIAPASGLKSEKIREIGAFDELVVSSLIFSEENPPYHSNIDEIRIRDLISALKSEEPIIWAARGGYGSARLAPYIKDSYLIKRKILIGYSDITALHILFNRYGLKSIHGANLNELFVEEKDPLNISIILEILSGKRSNLTYQNIHPLNKNAISSKVEGQLIGGNLTLVTNSIGTVWEIDTKDKIIFLEDIGAKGYVIDRDLNHLTQAGIFKNAKAVLFGNFKNGDEWIEYAINRFAQEINIPVYISDQFGHGKKNYPLVFGAKASIEAEQLYIEF